MDECENRIQCRSCLSTTAAEFIHLDSAMERGCSYLECFNMCTDLKANLEDELPDTICATCSHDLQVAYNFVMEARQADTFLRQHLNQQNEHENVEKFDLECETTQDNDQVKEIDVLDESQIDIIQEDEDYECEEMETVEENQVLEQLKIEGDMSTSDRLKFLDLEYSSNIKAEPQDSIASESNSEDEKDDKYLIEYNEEDVDAAAIKLESRQGSKWKCKECKRILRGDVPYEGHMNMHKNLKPYKCTKCRSAFRCKYALEGHVCKRHGDSVSKIPNQKYLSCDKCEQIFNSSESLQEHLKEKHRTELEKLLNHETKDENSILEISPCNVVQVQCPYCNESQLENDEILEHIRLKHPSEHSERTLAYQNENITKTQWQCNICFTYLESRNMLKAHRNSHMDERAYACIVCSKPFTTTKNLRSHLRAFHQEEYKKYVEDDPEEYVSCQVCNKSFLKKNIEKHLKIHDRKEKEKTDGTMKYLCAYCPRECKNQKTLNHHEKLHQTEASGLVYQCAECERQYATQQHLEQHRKQAHKERDNICRICGNAFKLKNQLVNHMKLHLEKNIPCPHCDKKYARPFDLNVHLRSHTGELPYGCHLCEKRFAIKVRLTYHLQKHLGIKHRCKECGAEFNSKQKLKAHSYKHTGMPYRCETCNNHGFANRDVFKRHLLRVHNATMPDELLVAMFQRNTGKTIRIQTIEKDDHNVFVPKNDTLEAICSDELNLVEEVIT